MAENQAQFEEENPLLVGTPSSSQQKQATRDRLVTEAVSSLNYVTLIFAWTCIIAIVIAFVNEYIDEAIPLWVIFLDLWIGHFILFILAVFVLSLVFRSLAAQSEKERQTARWHQANEKRIPLVQFLIYNISWVLGLSTVLIIVEILLYLDINGKVPSYSFLVPLYIVVGFALLSAMLCRSVPFSALVSWLLALTTIVEYNIKLQIPNALSWLDVLLPSFIFFGYWILICSFVAVSHIYQLYRLKRYQLEMLLLYVIALTTFFLADLALLGYLDSDTFYGYSYLKVATGLAIAGGSLFFVGLAKGIDAAITTTLNRFGAERPRPLMVAEGGGWQVDESASYVNSLLFGEIETSKSVSNMMTGSPTRGGRTEKDRQMNCFDSAVDAIFCYVYPVATPSRRNNLFRDQNGEGV